jgi:glycosyltransferase involved in cell wall biosynthesis
VIGWVGRLVPAKLPGDFLEAVALAARRVPRLRALVVGDGPERGEAEARARALGIEGRVVFAGLRMDVAELLGGMEALVFSSEREGLSIAMLEGMAAGVPIVATRVGGTPELVEDGTSGLLVPPHAPGELAAAITRVLEDGALAAALARPGAGDDHRAVLLRGDGERVRGALPLPPRTPLSQRPAARSRSARGNRRGGERVPPARGSAGYPRRWLGGARSKRYSPSDRLSQARRQEHA